VIVGFLSIALESSLALNSWKGRTGFRKETIHVILLVRGLAP